MTEFDPDDRSSFPSDERSFHDDEPAAVYARLYPSLLTAARRLGLERDAEDLAQEALVQVLVRYPAFRGLEFPLAYTKTVLFRIASRHRRRQVLERDELGRGLAVALESVAPDVSVEVISRLSAVFVLGRLPPRQRACLYLTFVEGLSDAEVSQVLGCRPSTVRSQIGRALRTLAGTVGTERELVNLGLNR